MADPDGMNARNALMEELEAYRARLRQAESGKSKTPDLGPDQVTRLKRIIADLEAKMRSLPKE
jgi:hypothetical protein